MMKLFRHIKHKCVKRRFKRHINYMLWMTLLNFLFLISAVCHTSKPNPQYSVEAFTTYLNQRIPQLMKTYDISGVAMALLHSGDMVWSNAYGYADQEHQRLMTVEAVCRVESISKSVTAWGVMRLVEQGLLELDSPIQKNLRTWKLPATPFDPNQITVRRLLSGNTGLSLGTIGKTVEYEPQTPMPTLQDFLNQEVNWHQEPGSGFMYSNTGYSLLELLIEEVTGRDFAAYMADEILAPLGMKYSSFAWQEWFHSAIPTGYELNGSAVPPYVYPARASGGLFATVKDIASFVCAGMTGAHVDCEVLKWESIQQIYTPQVEIDGLFGFVADEYGFGHFIEILSDGRKAVWHGGQGHGWMTHFHSIPESGDGIVILTNSQRSWPFMAQVLSDWSGWLGIKPVKMGRITIAVKALWTLIGFVALISLLQAYWLFTGLIKANRRFAPFSLEHRVVRLLQMVFGLVIIAVLTWSITQPYLFITSIFPHGVQWGAFALLAFSLINVISALFPTKNQTT